MFQICFKGILSRFTVTLDIILTQYISDGYLKFENRFKDSFFVPFPL